MVATALGACGGSSSTVPMQQPPPAVEPAPTSSPSVIGTAQTELASQPEPAAPSQGSLFEQAQRCLREPLCSREQAARLYLAAADAAALPVVTEGIWAGFDCYVLLRGVGVPADPTRARRCFERVVAASDCSGGSPWLPRLELAVMWLSGRGGPADPARTQALLEGCFEDGSVQALRDEARSAGRRPGDRTHLDFCQDFPATTLAMNACAERDRLLSLREMELLAKEPQFAAQESVRKAYAAAMQAFVEYAHAHAEYDRDFYRGGSMAPLVFTGTYTALVQQRTRYLRAMAAGSYRGTEAAAQAAGKELKRVYEGVRLGTPDAQRRKLLDRAQHAFVSYRRAEIELYVAALADTHPEPAIRHQVRIDLSRARSQTLEEDLQTHR